MSIGIYKITNLLNNKIYIGQSVQIETRFQFHKNFYHKSSHIDQEINRLGVENFKFEIIELCDKMDLDAREKYWIAFYDCIHPQGYNFTIGGQKNRSGVAIDDLTDEEVAFIRECYAEQTYNSAAEIQRLFFPHKDRHLIAKIYNGQIRLDIKPEVYNQNYYFISRMTWENGENNPAAKLKEFDVIKIRTMYSIMPRKDIFAYFEGVYAERAITSIISGQNWKHLPIYKKREKRWIYPHEWTEQNINDFNLLRKEILDEFK